MLYDSHSLYEVLSDVFLSVHHHHQPHIWQELQHSREGVPVLGKDDGETEERNLGRNWFIVQDFYEAGARLFPQQMGKAILRQSGTIQAGAQTNDCAEGRVF